MDDFEIKKWTHELSRVDAHRAHDRASDFHGEVNKAAIESGNLALRTLVLINGGAAVAILGLLGAIAAKAPSEIKLNAGPVAGNIKYFAFGVALACLAMGFGYVTNYLIAGHANSMSKTYEYPFVSPGPLSSRWRAGVVTFHVAAMLAAIASLVLFMIGMYAASDTVTALLAKPA